MLHRQRNPNSSVESVGPGFSESSDYQAPAAFEGNSARMTPTSVRKKPSRKKRSDDVDSSPAGKSARRKQKSPTTGGSADGAKVVFEDDADVKMEILKTGDIVTVRIKGA
jgi:hypothetical protein